jgi:hypothetical protein
MTKEQFDAYASWMYNDFFSSDRREMYKNAAENALPGQPRSVSSNPDGSHLRYFLVFMNSTRDEQLRQERGLKVYHVLTAIYIPQSYVERIMMAYYPPGTLRIVRDGENKMCQVQGGYVLHSDTDISTHPEP